MMGSNLAHTVRSIAMVSSEADQCAHTGDSAVQISAVDNHVQTALMTSLRIGEEIQLLNT